jgi:TolA-binding protein
MKTPTIPKNLSGQVEEAVLGFFDPMNQTHSFKGPLQLIVEYKQDPKQLEKQLERIEANINKIMATVQELSSILTEVGTQIEKAQKEILAKLDQLSAGNLPPEAEAAVADLRAKVQALDDIVPDQPA